MSLLRDSVAAMREAFVDDAFSCGFRLYDDCSTLVGDVDVDGISVEHQIHLDADFPITMPRVSTTGGEGGLSWHRNGDGTLCLWSDDEASDLPWRSAEAVIDRIAEWHINDAAGWPDDHPDLDLERYWSRSDELILYPDLDDLAGRPCRACRQKKSNVFKIEPGPAGKHGKQKQVLPARIVDIGELAKPVRNFDDLESLLTPDCAAAIRIGIEQGRIRVLLVRYRRQGNEAAMALVTEKPTTRQLNAAQSAHLGQHTHYLRAGLDAEALLPKRVAVVGVGAVGSAAAEMLTRSGIGTISLVDGDLIRPGNCIRHVADHNYVGWNKADAVKGRLVNAELIAKSEVHVHDQPITSVDDIEKLFEFNDLVLDATGDGPATALVLLASEILGKPVVSVCLQRGGSVARVDRAPLRPSEKHLPPVPRGGPQLDLREAGCGDPVSPAPPWVCSAAAARAVGMVTDLLSDRCQYPPTVIDVLIGDPLSESWHKD